MNSKEIFVSYSSSDAEIAFDLVRQLESKGVNCWVAPRDIGPGKDYGEEIVAAIKNSVMLAVVFSDSSNKSKHVLREVDKALSLDKIIIPIKIDSSFPSGGMDYRLSTVQWLESGIPILTDTIEKTINVLNAAAKREHINAGNIQAPEYVILNRCARCGSQYAEHDPLNCSYHPLPPEIIENAGPDRDYADIWQFPCCGQKYIGTFNEKDGSISDAKPPKSPGCMSGKHVPKFSFRQSSR